MNKLLSNLKVRHKLGLIVGLALACLVLIEVTFLVSLRDNLMAEKKLKTQHAVQTASGVLDYYYRLTAEGKMTVPEAQQKALTTIRMMRYGARDYFWVNDTRPVLLAHPFLPEWEGKDVSGFKDPLGKRLFLEFVQTVRRNKSGYVDYKWNKAGAVLPEPKISYVQAFEPWHWIIGSGIYVGDVHDLFWKRARQHSVDLLMILAVLGILSWVLAHSITGPMLLIKERLERLAQGDKEPQLMDAAADHRWQQAALTERGDEIGVLARAFSHMSQQLRDLFAQIERREARFRSLIENASDVIVVMDRGGVLIYVSPSVQRILGHAANTLLEKSLYDFVHHEDAPSAHAWFDRLLAHPGAVETLEFRFRVNGDWQLLEATGNNRLDDSAVNGIVLNLRDITEKKRAEQFERDKRAAEEANRTKSAFLANMSHELRTPMNAIIGYTEMMIEEAEDAGQTGFIPDLQKVRAAGKHLLALINDILDLSKIEAGKMTLFLETFAVGDMINDVVATTVPLVEKNSNRLLLEIAPDTGKVRADLTKVRQLLFNLLSNACKFTENGTITLTVNRFRRADREWIRYQVRDSGIGMSSAQMGKLFQAFSQADASTSRKYGGTGLGLALSRKFCQMMGGDVQVASEPGEGSTFTVELPRDVEAAQPERPAEAAPLAPALISSPATAVDNGKTVLVIDDDPSVHDMMIRHLAKEGYRIVIATNGKEGLEQARATRPDAITLDVMMPGTDGWAVLTAIKSDPQLAHIPVIMLTVVEGKDLGFALGAVDYFIKPIEWDRLLNVLQRYCATGDKGKILLVDDDPQNLEMMRRTLEKQGYHSANAENGKVALELLAREKPALILLDLMMPVMDGFEFMDVLRQKPEYANIPVVVITAKDLTKEDRARLQGCVANIVEKGSMDRHQLLENISRLVAGNLTSVANPPPSPEVPHAN
jgi:PAS domain S-box-containing protein